MASIVFVRASSAGHLNVSGAKLGVVEEEGGLGRGFLFEGYGGFLGLTGGLDLDTSNLAAVAELVLIVRLV